MTNLDEFNYGTVYNGSAACSACGCMVTPIVAMYSQGPVLCPDCKERKATAHVRNRMAAN